MTLAGPSASPTPQSTASSIEPIIYSSNNGISWGNVAAIVGCSLGILLVLFMFYTCRRGQRRPQGLSRDPRETGAPGREGRDWAAGAAGARGERGQLPTLYI